MNLRGNIFSLCLLCLGMMPVNSQAASTVIELDTVINWDSQEMVSISAVEERMLPLRKYREEWAVDIDGVLPQKLCSWRGFSPRDFQLTLFGEQLNLEDITLGRRDSGINQFSLRLSLDRKSAGLDDRLHNRLADKLRGRGARNVHPDGKYTSINWDRQGWSVSLETQLEGEKDDKQVQINFVRQMSSGAVKPAAVPQNPQNLEVSVDLDYLLNLAALWNCTPDAFEKIYRPKTEGRQEQPPQFEWLSTDRSRARFSKRLFSNLEAKMTIFAKSVKVDEAVVEFVDGRAARVTISLFNRGDSGDISPDQFDQLYMTAGKSLGQILKVAPLNISNAVTSAIKTVSWQWRSPAGIVLLEHNDYKSGRTVGRPEFLRMKLANPQQADWSIGKLSVGVQRMALMKNITKMDNGDVYISGVPMVDQGDKGYCVAASCQRLFEYMQIPCDQHEIAQLAGVDAQSGANIFDMQKSLARIDGHYKVSFKPHINPELYYSTTGKRRISERQFAVIIKEHVDKAVPLLWALELGRFPEDPPLPNGGQVSGGHMRMIIGYNTAKKQVIFSDSWGAGHEIKRMSEAGAYEATIGLFSMSPRGL